MIVHSQITKLHFIQREREREREREEREVMGTTTEPGDRSSFGTNPVSNILVYVNIRLSQLYYYTITNHI